MKKEWYLGLPISSEPSATCMSFEDVKEIKKLAKAEGRSARVFVARTLKFILKVEKEKGKG